VRSPALGTQCVPDDSWEGPHNVVDSPPAAQLVHELETYEPQYVLPVQVCRHVPSQEATGGDTVVVAVHPEQVHWHVLQRRSFSPSPHATSSSAPTSTHEKTLAFAHLLRIPPPSQSGIVGAPTCVAGRVCSLGLALNVVHASSWSSRTARHLAWRIVNPTGRLRPARRSGQAESRQSTRS
jgi:hypothetical protein